MALYGSNEKTHTRNLLYPEAGDSGFVCVRVPRPQQHQRQTTIPAFVASSPRIGALALACSTGRILSLQQQEMVSFKLNTAAADSHTTLSEF